MTSILLHIGHLKTGTIWLQEAFFDDPGTAYRWLDKRPHKHPVHRLIRDRPLEFDAAAVRGEFEPLLEEAKAADLTPVLSTGRLSGHTFSGGLRQQGDRERLWQVSPEARILIVIREQRSMIVSTYKQYISAGGPAASSACGRP